MADITVSYKGNTIAEMSESGSKTLKTGGKYCEGDISIDYVKSGGGRSFTINNGAYLFYQGIRLDMYDDLIGICKDLTRTDNMFSNCGSVTTINVSELDTCKVTNMENMFSNCEDLSNLDVSGFDTSNVTSFSNMFARCKKIADYNLSNWNTSKATNFSVMFSTNYALNFLDISSFNGSSATDTSQMFSKCSALKALVINNQNIFPMTNVNMFASSAIASGTGFVYVPDDMVDAYKAATNWSTYASQIKGMSELPAEYGGTAE